jgi:hypothetical protein
MGNICRWTRANSAKPKLCHVIRLAAPPFHDSHGEVEDSPLSVSTVDAHESFHEGVRIVHKLLRVLIFVVLVRDSLLLRALQQGEYVGYIVAFFGAEV